jgi:hypothetical protein
VWDLAARRMTFQRMGRSTSGDALLEALLDAFEEVFAAPTGLPPKRAHDHHILLKPNAQPVAVRPYQYPAAQKDELERQ